MDIQFPHQREMRSNYFQYTGLHINKPGRNKSSDKDDFNLLSLLNLLIFHSIKP